MPHFSRAYWTVGLIQEQQGEFEESVAAFERAIQLSAQNPRMKAALARTLAGKKRPAGRMLAELKELAGSGMFSPFDIASIHFAPGERAEGVEWMGQAFRWTRGLIRCGGDAEFVELAKQLGL